MRTRDIPFLFYHMLLLQAFKLFLHRAPLIFTDLWKLLCKFLVRTFRIRKIFFGNGRTFFFLRVTDEVDDDFLLLPWIPTYGFPPYKSNWNLVWNWVINVISKLTWIRNGIVNWS